MANGYDKAYYDNYDMGEGGIVSYLECEPLRHFMSVVAQKIVDDFRPASMLDAGCAMGILVSEFRKRGVEAYGIDYSDYAVENADPIARPYCVQGSLADPVPELIDRKFDLVTCFEVLEHMSEEDGKKAIENLTKLSDTIVFCSTPDDYEDPTHVNVRQRNYWARCFAECGFYDDVFYRPVYITPYAVCYRKRDKWVDQVNLYEQYIQMIDEKEAEGKKLQAERDDILAAKEANQQKWVSSTVYFKTDNEFDRQNSIEFTNKVGTFDIVLLEADIPIPMGCNVVRFDPCEQSYCVIHDVRFIYDGKAKSYKLVNGFEVGDTIFFPTEDPQFEIELPGNGGITLHVSMVLRLYDIRDLTIDAVKKSIDDLQARITDKDRQIVEANQAHAKELSEVIVAKDARIEEIITLKDAQIEQMQKDHAHEIADWTAEVKSKNARIEEVISLKDAQIEQMQKAHLGEMEAQKHEYQAQIEAMKTDVNAKDSYIGEVVELCNSRQSQIEALLNENQQLSNRCHHAEESYAVVTNAFFWKITKPARAVLDGTKRIIGKNKKLYTLLRSAKWTLRYGPKEARRRRKELRSTVSSAPMIAAVQSGDGSVVQKATNISSNAGTVNGDVCFSVIVPLYNTDAQFLREMIDSVLGQTYANWELCLADASDEAHSYVGDICREYAARDNRVRYFRLEQNLMIAGNTNAAVSQAKGDFIALLDHDDLLDSNALEWNAKEIARTGCDVIYSDEDHLLLNGQHGSVLHKPDWSPDLLNSQMYICHLLVIRRALFDRIGGFRSAFDGSQDYDLMLRLSEQTNKIQHIPEVLYTWRESPTSTAANADSKPYAQLAGLHALNDHLKRVYGPDAHADESEYLFVYDARYPLPEDTMVSIIIPMKDKWELTEACIKSIEEKSTWKNYEIIILDNRSKEKGTYKWLKAINKNDPRVRVVKADMEFNWSKLNNFGMQQAKGNVYIFLNNDTLVISPDWMERLSEKALREEVGAVGPLLLYEDETIQHAGVVVGFGGWADHVFKGMKPVHYGSPFISPMVTRNVLAVTGACMAVSKKTIEKIGGFDETFIICGSDVELCIRAHERGLFNVYDAGTRLYHLESKSRDSHIPDIDFKRSYECYTPYREGVDPFYNKNLDRDSVIPRTLK